MHEDGKAVFIRSDADIVGTKSLFSQCLLYFPLARSRPKKASLYLEKEQQKIDRVPLSLFLYTSHPPASCACFSLALGKISFLQKR